MSFIVTVDWQIKPEHSEAFALRAKRQAADSFNLEVNCLYFDLSRSHDSPDNFFMYEIYSTQEAFDLHLASDHFANFSKDVADMVIAKKLQKLQMI